MQPRGEVGAGNVYEMQPISFVQPTHQLDLPAADGALIIDIDSEFTHLDVPGDFVDLSRRMTSPQVAALGIAHQQGTN